MSNCSLFPILLLDTVQDLLLLLGIVYKLIVINIRHGPSISYGCPMMYMSFGDDLFLLKNVYKL